MSATFQIKGSLFTLSVLKILSTDLDAIEKQITTKITQAPQFFNNTPMVIELSALNRAFLTVKFIENLTSMLKKHTLLPVGFRLPDQTLAKNLEKKGFPVFKEEKNSTTSNISFNKAPTFMNKIIHT